MYNKFRILVNTKTFNYKNRKEISLGCTIDEPEPEILETFENEEEALKALEEYKSYIIKYNNGLLFEVVEIALESYEADEDGEFLSGSDYRFAEFNEEAVELLEKLKSE